MKKIILLFSLICIIFSFTACDSENNASKNAEVGDKLDAPEKIVSIEDYEKLTLEVSYTREDTVLQNATRSFYRKGNNVLYYSENSSEYFSQSLLVKVWDGEMLSYNIQDPISKKYVLCENALYDGQNNEEYMKISLANFGIDFKNDSSISGKFVKCPDEKIGDTECYVYDTKLSDDSDLKIYVDKNSGLWIKQIISMPDGEDIVSQITQVNESAIVIPGTLPVEMESQVIYEENGIKITAKTLDFSDPNFAAKLVIDVSNTTDKDVRIYTNSLDVNGLALAQKAFDITCTAGTSSEHEIEIPQKSADLAGIELISTINMSLVIQDPSDENSKKTVEANEIKTKAPTGFVQQIDKSGIEVLNDSGVRVVFQSFEKTSIGTFMFKAWCENTYTEPIRITVNLNKINGEEYNDFEKLYMPANSEGYTAFYLYDTDFDDIETAEITCEAFYGELFKSTRLTEESEPTVIQLN